MYWNAQIYLFVFTSCNRFFSCQETLKLTDNDTEDHASEASTPVLKVNTLKKFNEEEPISTPANAFEDIKLAFNNITSMIIGSNPKVKFTLSLSGIPLSSPIGRKAETDKVIQKFDNHEKTDNQSPPTVKENNRQQTWETSFDTMTTKNLFSQYERRVDNDFYINYQPLRSYGNEGRTVGVTIPQVSPFVVNLFLFYLQSLEMDLHTNIFSFNLLLLVDTYII